jgi:transcriptional regulator with XRE-family HTH domain|tara:strand:- start:815 stop:1024 length:210 start_codon:yes stop_codon:yes gene_type:complete
MISTVATSPRLWGGSQLRSLRQRRGWTQSDLAHELGISLGTLWAWETDRRPVNRSAVRLLDLIEDDRIK